MHLEHGSFGPHEVRYGNSVLRITYAACVVIPASEHERLQSRHYEKPDVLTPYVSYLHEVVGRCWIDWMLDRWRVNPSSDIVYFKRPEDGLLFLLRWSA
jgi:hypothetical protein